MSSSLSKIFSRGFLLLIVFLSLQPCLAEDTRNFSGSWVPQVIKLPITKKIESVTLISPRINNNFRDFAQLLIREDLYYNFNSHWAGTIGYGWLSNYPGDFNQQHWLIQGLRYRNQYKKLRFSYLLRLDNRFFSVNDSYNARLRNKISLIYPMPWINQPGLPPQTFLSIFDELMINLNDADGAISTAGVDINRFFVGLKHKVSPNLSIEGGYQLEFINSASPNRLEHIGLLRFIWDFS